MEKLSKVIGIISYLPSRKAFGITKWFYRVNQLKNLLDKCNEIFKDIPIIIIAQNWPDQLFYNQRDIIVCRYKEPLTIVGARLELRKKFLELGCDYLIMLDGDCQIIGDAVAGEKYLQQIDENPDCWIEFNGTVFKLFAISKKIYQEIELDEVHAERNEGWEDGIYFAKLRAYCPEAYRKFKDTGLMEASVSYQDRASLWSKLGQNFDEMRANNAAWEKKYEEIAKSRKKDE